MLALDFISLLLSKHAPRQAETSMSPLLKQLAPLGSLDSDMVNPPPRSESAIKDVATVSRGWRIQNFNAASNKLLSAATRLNGEIESETRYWNEVLNVKDKGWKVCRHPRERQALAVQYGFMEGMMSYVLRRRVRIFLTTYNSYTYFPRPRARFSPTGKGWKFDPGQRAASHGGTSRPGPGKTRRADL
jgi:hypothetical protein